MRLNAPNAQSICIFFVATLLLSACSTNKLDRSKKPEPGKAPDVSFSDYEKFQLDNGLTVFVVEDEQSPKVTYSLEIDRDPIAQGEKAGYVSLAGDMIGTATNNRSKDELNQEVDFIGATLSANPTGVNASALKKRKEKLLDLTADVIKNSTFTQDELEKKKKRLKSGIKGSEEDPGSIASNVFKKLIYGQDHPYADVSTVESVDRVEMADIKEYYNKYYRPNISYLAVVGNTSKEEIKPLLEKKLGDWQEEDVPDHDYDQPKQLESPKVAVVNRPNASQSTVRIGHTVDLQLSDDDYASAQLTNTILGGGAFRLFENLR
ncbi:MAG: peptidase M16, partial [Bacteroidetes bacterium SW_11_45_7]